LRFERPSTKFERWRYIWKFRDKQSRVTLLVFVKRGFPFSTIEILIFKSS